MPENQRHTFILEFGGESGNRFGWGYLFKLAMNGYEKARVEPLCGELWGISR